MTFEEFIKKRVCKQTPLLIFAGDQDGYYIKMCCDGNFGIETLRDFEKKSWTRHWKKYEVMHYVPMCPTNDNVWLGYIVWIKRPEEWKENGDW